ncbi:MAG: hypothetical protein IT378_19975, partial [Sandaracinaceae bacterium]|nr:hypothetical protein [Sandaracinaceae bacterium]
MDVRHVFLWMIVSAIAQAQAQPSLDFLDVPERPVATAAPRSSRRLAELEAELSRFEESARAYREAVDAQTRRRARAMRREIAERYEHGLRTERRLEAIGRARAIRELQRFLQLHPADGDRTADALLRLAELETLAALEAVDRGERTEPDLATTIALARRLVREHTGYRHLDRAAYLLGYALEESGRPDEALAAYRGIVCADRFGFEPAAVSDPQDPLHPALPAAPASSPYEGCRPLLETPLAAELWLGIGEHHFEGGDRALPAAIAAYERVVAAQDDRLFTFGLYKLAWSHYRASEYPQALEHFARLVDHSDAELARTGRAGSELRAEAMEYLAITLAFPDWNENGADDPDEGLPGPLARLRDPSLVPQDRAWTPELRRRTAEILYAEARYEDAIAAWRLALPVARCDAPEILVAIARAERRRGDEAGADAALLELTELPALGDGCRDPARMERLMRDALAAVGTERHRRAQLLRRRGSAEAGAEYARAIAAYDRFLARFASDPLAYEIAFDRAEALRWSDRYEEAARAFEAVRDSTYDDRLLAAAARRVVEAQERQRAREGVAMRADVAPEPTEVPLALQRVSRAREIYVRWVGDARDTEGVRDAYAFNNALVARRYGFAGAARERFTRLFEERCRGPHASDVGRSAWLALREMAAERQDLDALGRLTAELRARACTFAPEGAPVLAEGCREPGSFTCEVDHTDAAVRFERLEREARGLGASDADRARAVVIASQMVAAVDRDPSGADSPARLSRAAHLLQDAGRLGDAERVYRRIVDELDPRQAGEVVVDAQLQLARIAHHLYDVDAALAGYEAVAQGARDRAAQRDASVNAALLASAAGRHAEAARLWSRAAERLEAAEAREARLRVAQETLLSGDARGAARSLDAWLRAGTGDLVRAHDLRARAAAALGDQQAQLRSLEAAGRAYRASGLARERASGAIAARAALALAQAR